MKKTILSAKNVQKTFTNSGEQLHVLTDVNLEVYSGDFTVIMGSSGSGKSTLLYALSGMDGPTSGQVIYSRPDGDDIEISALKESKLADIRVKDFGFVFQQMHLVSNLSLFENVAVTGYLDKTRSAADTKKRADELLDRVGLKDVKKHLPSRVSGGEQQRCAIARAVINKPALLFADEPTGALNRNNTKEVLNLLSELNREGQSIVMVTHDIKAAVRADRILYLDDGNIAGELELTKYGETDKQGELLQSKKAREAQINAWLESLDW